jgi:hypothetical protein
MSTPSSFPFTTSSRRLQHQPQLLNHHQQARVLLSRAPCGPWPSRASDPVSLTSKSKWLIALLDNRTRDSHHYHTLLFFCRPLRCPSFLDAQRLVIGAKLVDSSRAPCRTARSRAPIFPGARGGGSVWPSGAEFLTLLFVSHGLDAKLLERLPYPSPRTSGHFPAQSTPTTDEPRLPLGTLSRAVRSRARWLVMVPRVSSRRQRGPTRWLSRPSALVFCRGFTRRITCSAR